MYSYVGYRSAITWSRVLVTNLVVYFVPNFFHFCTRLCTYHESTPVSKNKRLPI